ncbi:hypothetical protein OG288_42400 [Streptomyces tauricus]|uniref:Fic family toxin-antitoxin system, toxin component n=1 Tax=Streptomyces tauricus TaxID=68274 RepID=A0ABZ1JTR3_9ACTN|nr:hypothetical protein [Streptomyces tauricus]MCW8100352.1 hypothetical protein [Streptomyces tauricus]
MNLRIGLAWILAAAQQIAGDPQVVDYGVPVAAEARHRAEVLDREVYPEPHHKAAALLCWLARNPSLEVRNLLFAATVTAAYLSACGLPLSPRLDTALPLAGAARDGLPVREVAAQIKTWTS